MTLLRLILQFDTSCDCRILQTEATQVSQTWVQIHGWLHMDDWFQNTATPSKGEWPSRLWGNSCNVPAIAAKGIHYQRKNGYGWRSVSRIELDPFPLHPNNQNLNLIQCNEKGPQTLGTFFPVLNFCFWHPWKHDCHCQFSSKHTNTKQCLALSKVLFNCTLFKMLVNFFTSAYL